MGYFKTIRRLSFKSKKTGGRKTKKRRGTKRQNPKRQNPKRQKPKRQNPKRGTRGKSHKGGNLSINKNSKGGYLKKFSVKGGYICKSINNEWVPSLDTKCKIKF